MLTSPHLHEQDREVCIKTSSTPASLLLKGQVTEQTIDYYIVLMDSSWTANSRILFPRSRVVGTNTPPSNSSYGQKKIILYVRCIFWYTSLPSTKQQSKMTIFQVFQRTRTPGYQQMIFFPRKREVTFRNEAFVAAVVAQLPMLGIDRFC